MMNLLVMLIYQSYVYLEYGERDIKRKNHEYEVVQEQRFNCVKFVNLNILVKKSVRLKLFLSFFP